MADVCEEMIAVAFALPEVSAVFLALFGAFGVEVVQEAQYDYFAQFKFACFSRKIDLIARDTGQHALVVFR